MSTYGRMRSWEYLDDPWRRLTWIVPTSVLLWAGMLVAFATLLKRIPPVPPELPPADVRFVELPPAAAPAAPAAHYPAPARPKPRIIPARPHHHYVPIRRAPVPARRIVRRAPPAPPHIAASNPAPASSAKESSTRRASKSVQGSGIGSGVGSDSGGARAIYAPKPVIPDDLRNQMIRTVAVAHFEVASNGKVEVSLTKPTDIPELNQILLDTLKQWRFFPAMKNGVAINSQFDVRIPISVQ